MRLMTVLVHTCSIVAATAIAATMAAPAQAAGVAQEQIIPVPFTADSGDGCGVTSGELGWHVSPGPVADPGIVDVTGVLVDHPLPDTPPVCPDDGRLTIAAFTAFAGEQFVSTAARMVDNGSLSLSFQLSGVARPPAELDRIVVQVCRTSATDTYCGTPQTYLRPPVG